MKKLLLLIILILPFVITTCKDEPKPQYFIDQETKDYTVFKEGTYWVYENQSNEIDTQIVRGFIRDNGDPHLSYDPETFQLNITSSYYKDEMCNQTKIDINDKTIFFVQQLWVSSFTSTYNSYVSVGTIGETILNLKLLDTISIYNNGYSDFNHVKKFEANTNIKNSYTEVYWAKHIGRIEYLDTEGNRWRLKRYKIIQ